MSTKQLIQPFCGSSISSKVSLVYYFYRKLSRFYGKYLPTKKIRFDRYGSVPPVIDEIKQFTNTHPEMEEEWAHLEKYNKVEEKDLACEEIKFGAVRD